MRAFMFVEDVVYLPEGQEGEEAEELVELGVGAADQELIQLEGGGP